MQLFVWLGIEVASGAFLADVIEQMTWQVYLDKFPVLVAKFSVLSLLDVLLYRFELTISFLQMNCNHVR